VVVHPVFIIPDFNEDEQGAPGYQITGTALPYDTGNEYECNLAAQSEDSAESVSVCGRIQKYE
jgi:hypothetical protein